MSVVDDDEKLVDLMAHEIVSDVKASEDFIGDRPFGQEKIPERQQVKESGLLWAAPAEAWTALLDQKGDKAVHAYVTRMNRLREKYPEEAKFIPPLPGA